MKDESVDSEASAEKLSLGQSTIYRMVANGEFPKPFVLYSNRTAWLDEDVDAWLAERAGKAVERREPSTAITPQAAHA